MKQIKENIVTMQMTYLMDERFVNFANDCKADAGRLSNKLLRGQKKFPKEQFTSSKTLSRACLPVSVTMQSTYRLSQRVEI